MNTTRLIPPAIPLRVALSIAILALLCILVPRVAQASYPASITETANVTAHLTITQRDSEVPVRLSLCTSEEGGQARTTITNNNIKYEANIQTHKDDGAITVRVGLEVHDSDQAWTLNTKLVGIKGSRVLLGRIGNGMQAVLQLE